MSVPVSNYIIDDIVSTIGAIEAGTSYNRTVRVCKRLTFVPSELAQYDAVFVYDSGCSKDYLNSSVVRCTQQIMLDCWIQDDDPATAIDQLSADIEKALSVDITRSGKAIDTQINAVRKYISQDMQPEGNCEIDITVTYRHQEGDPYTEI